MYRVDRTIEIRPAADTVLVAVVNDEGRPVAYARPELAQQIAELLSWAPTRADWLDVLERLDVGLTHLRSMVRRQMKRG